MLTMSGTDLLFEAEHSIDKDILVNPRGHWYIVLVCLYLTNA